LDIGFEEKCFSTFRRLTSSVRPAVLAGAILALVNIDMAGALENTTKSPWPDTFTTRLEALAILQSFNAELLSNPSATLTLDRWCAAHHLAPAGSKIIAERVRGQDKDPDADIRAMLKVDTDEPVAYRRVRLRCGDRVLSEADNWYVPARLSTEMNQQLNTTDTSFGRVVQPLDFSRSTLSAKLLWQPLPDGWDMGADVAPPSQQVLAPPHFLLEHRAVLKIPNGTPFSAVVETYTSDILDFPAPPSRPNTTGGQ
jgi:hypothetical protein